MKTQQISKSSRKHMVTALLLISDDKSGSYATYLQRQSAENISALFEANKAEIEKVRDIMARRERQDQQRLNMENEAREKEARWNSNWKAPKPIAIKEQPADPQELVNRIKMMIMKCDARIEEFTIRFKTTGDPEDAKEANLARAWKKQLEGMNIEEVVTASI